MRILVCKYKGGPVGNHHRPTSRVRARRVTLPTHA
jgi:hypothetical protein